MNVWPGVTINNVTYRGSHNGTDVMEAVCAHMLNPTSACEDLMEEYIPEYNGGISVTTIVIIVITILVVFFFFMVFVYRRMVRKEMTKEMNA